MHTLDPFFKPRGIAVVGASADHAKPGNAILRRLVEMGFKGGIYPVNPREKEIMKLRCYSSVVDVDGVVDLVVLLLPAQRAVEAARDIAERAAQVGDAKAVICVSGGFKELGTEEGVERERKLTDTLKEAGVRLIGPNCLGIIDTYSRVTTNFDVGNYPAGGLSIITQSGALATSLLFWALRYRRIGLSKFISLGNMADVDIVEVLNYLGEDENTRVIALYLEGIENPRRLFQTAQQVTPRKPVVMLKAGKSELGSKAAKSHTGALTGPDILYTIACRQTGVIRAESLLDFYETLHALEKQPIPRGNRVFILTHIGGPGTLCLDEIGRTENLDMAVITEKAREEIRRMIAPTATFCRPEGYIDVTASHTEELHNKILKVLFNEENVDAVIQIMAPSRFLSERLMAENVVDAYENAGRKHGKTFLNVITYSDSASECKMILEEKGLPTFDTPEIAVKILSTMVNYRLQVEKLKDRYNKLYPLNPSNKFTKFRERAEKAGRKHLLEPEAYELLRNIGIQVPKYTIIRNAGEAEGVGDVLDFPVVVKVVSPHVIHKTDVGGVVTGVSSVGEVVKAVEVISRNVAAKVSGVGIDGFLVQEMVRSRIELSVGAVRDEYFGPVVEFGLGGLFIEALRDVSFRLAPLTLEDALDMIRETKAYNLLTSRRLGIGIKVDKLAELIVGVGELIAGEEWIKEIDLNPVMPVEDGFVAVDGRVIIQ